jgi:hypothetical protein
MKILPLLFHTHSSVFLFSPKLSTQARSTSYEELPSQVKYKRHKNIQQFNDSRAIQASIHHPYITPLSKKSLPRQLPLQTFSSAFLTAQKRGGGNAHLANNTNAQVQMTEMWGSVYPTELKGKNCVSNLG